VRKLAAGDPIQPRHRRAAGGIEPVRAVERGGEGLGAQVRGQLGVVGPAQEVAEQGGHVAAVEDREAVGLGAQAGEDGLVVLHMGT
jgi:hypothetical protein